MKTDMPDHTTFDQITPRMAARLRSARVYSTGMVAKVCGVASRTVSKWHDAGKLRGYRIPGSKDRRFTREAVEAFLRAEGIPASVFAEFRSLLFYACRPGLCGTLAGALGVDWRVSPAMTAADAGFALAERPDAVLVDLACGIAECAALLRLAPEGTRVFALACEDTPPEALGGYAASWAWPCDAAQIAAGVRGEG